MTGEAEFQAIKDRLRKHLLKYTRRAFRMLPPLEKPRILDIGCGSGVPSIVLARLSRGQVIGLDIDPSLLAENPGKSESSYPDIRLLRVLAAPLRLVAIAYPVRRILSDFRTVQRHGQLPDHTPMAPD